MLYDYGLSRKWVRHNTHRRTKPILRHVETRNEFLLKAMQALQCLCLSMILVADVILRCVSEILNTTMQQISFTLTYLDEIQF